MKIRLLGSGKGSHVDGDEMNGLILNERKQVLGTRAPIANPS